MSLKEELKGIKAVKTHSSNERIKFLEGKIREIEKVGRHAKAAAEAIDASIFDLKDLTQMSSSRTTPVLRTRS